MALRLLTACSANAEPPAADHANLVAADARAPTDPAARPLDVAFSTTIDPPWERTNEYFLAPSEPTPDLEYYTDNTYSLLHEDDSPAAPGFTWTTAAWNGPSTSDMPVDGPGAIPGFVPGDSWFWTTDRAGCTNVGTSYWFRTRIDVADVSRLSSISSPTSTTRTVWR